MSFGIHGRDIADWPQQAPIGKAKLPLQVHEFRGLEHPPRPSEKGDLGIVNAADGLGESSAAVCFHVANQWRGPSLKHPFPRIYQEAVCVHRQSSQHPCRKRFECKRQAKIRSVQKSELVTPAPQSCVLGRSAKILGRNRRRPIMRRHFDRCRLTTAIRNGLTSPSCHMRNEI